MSGPTTTATDGAGTTVLLEVHDGVAVIRLNRPDRGNAMTSEMGAGYVDALTQVDDDPDVRAVVVTGAGSSFCSGADLAALDAVGKGDGPGEGSRVEAGKLEDSYLRPLLSRKPYVAAVNGACVGVGLVIAMGCDLRFASADATIAAAFARLGLIADFGLSWLLPRVMGTEHAMDLLLSGRRVTGREARDLGLVSRALPTEDVLPQAMEYAHDLARNCAPTSMATIKQQVYLDLESSLAASYSRAVGHMKEAFAGPDLQEGVAAFRDRRPPNFSALRR